MSPRPDLPTQQRIYLMRIREDKKKETKQNALSNLNDITLNKEFSPNKTELIPASDWWGVVTICEISHTASDLTHQHSQARWAFPLPEELLCLWHQTGKVGSSLMATDACGLIEEVMGGSHSKPGPHLILFRVPLRWDFSSISGWEQGDLTWT